MAVVSDGWHKAVITKLIQHRNGTYTVVFTVEGEKLKYKTDSLNSLKSKLGDNLEGKVCAVRTVTKQFSPDNRITIFFSKIVEIDTIDRLNNEEKEDSDSMDELIKEHFIGNFGFIKNFEDKI